jgi:Fur family transcriptional regulator, iron response regulator
VRRDVIEQLRDHGIQPSAQRVAVAEYVLGAVDHPSADQVWARVQARFPLISRATVYNTLNLFVEKGLVRSLVLAEGRVVFDPKVDRHHHFIDEASGQIYDIPWNAVQVSRVGAIDGFDVREYQVVMRGRAGARVARRPRRTRSARRT